MGNEDIRMANDPESKLSAKLGRFFQSVWGLKVYAISSAVLAFIVSLLLDLRLPEHLVTVDEFIFLWFAMLIPSSMIIWLWRRFRPKKHP
jgi:hypothetical protein